MPLSGFDPLIAEWFRRRFESRHGTAAAWLARDPGRTGLY